MVLVEDKLDEVALNLNRFDNLAPQESIWDANVGPHEVPVPVEPRPGDLVIFTQDLPHRDNLLVEDRGGPEDEKSSVEVSNEDPEEDEKPSGKFRQEHLLILRPLSLNFNQHSTHIESEFGVSTTVFVQLNRASLLLF